MNPYSSNFYFDKRGEYKDGESPTVFAPIFSYNNNELHLRYLRNYIDDGYKTQNKCLTDDQIKSLNTIDEVTQNDRLAVDYAMKTGDMVFFNNHRILHGRSSFEDYDDENLKRKLVRVWIKNRNQI